MHKGYAFVQFTSPFDARSACLGEDGRSISGQVIDVNMVSEPKPNHGQQKANSSALGNKGIGQKRTHGDSGIGEGEEAGQVCRIIFSILMELYGRNSECINFKGFNIFYMF